MLANIGSFLGGFVLGNITGAIAGIVLYWYFVVHRKKINVPANIQFEVKR